MPVPTCPRPGLQLLHQTQIPVHGYDTATGLSNLPPCEGGSSTSPGSCRDPPHAPLRSRYRLFRLGGRQIDSDRPMLAHASPAKRAMNDKSGQNGQRVPEEDFSEFGEVRVISRPAPDAEDRLRRLFTILLRPSAGDGQAASEKDPPQDDVDSSDHLEVEA